MFTQQHHGLAEIRVAQAGRSDQKNTFANFDFNTEILPRLPAMRKRAGPNHCQAARLLQLIEGTSAIAQQIVIPIQVLVARFGWIDVEYGKVFAVAGSPILDDALGSHDFTVPNVGQPV